jgi:sugar lactone lactonase YvrE
VHDDETDTLYIANTGQGEILAFDTTTGEVVDELTGAPEPLQEYSEMGGAEFSVFAEGFGEPSGIAIAEDRLFVSDHESGDIVALDLSTGDELDRITVPEGKGVMGLEIGPDGLLYYTHGKDDITGRVDP